MARRTRAEMEETRATLLTTARDYFSRLGYAETSMDDLTASANLTRGALYHHFGDKKGLLAAVVEQIDAEMDSRLQVISNNAQNPWSGFCERCHSYLKMAIEPEYQRIVLYDAKAVFGGVSASSQQYCIDSMEKILSELIQQGVIAQASAKVLATLIYGSLAEAACWIAQKDSANRLTESITAIDLLLSGLLRK
ncbi:TetR/AcrR family transcriptional regulator [Providencia burhodogranariea]|uniref:TetR family transcriptional regulator n=1 Tax=Providencia burhodogranariea DSM 19968 TaxID=1141662 RepID=K8X017_9GAMM|nr:TetR/AcrR family transcriptional regulator [Providencia burhodogranariea]EKT62967.1 TetR family transcriptional regulator [Providencia burhodogranariea DSM 19968]